jgi:drug/metabolite transporter (DMT)-like permease
LDPIVFTAMLASAFLHAFWHAAARTRPAPSDALISMVISAGVWGVIALALVGPPPLAVFPWLLAALAANIVTFMLLVAAYERTAFVVAYPSARAMVAPLVLVFAFFAFGEWPGYAALAGIASVCVGVAALAVWAARRSRVDFVGLLFALAAAAATAAYGMIDASVVRGGAVVFPYAAAATVMNSLGFLAVYTWQGRKPLAILRREGGFAFMGSSASTTSYFLFIWSIQQAPVASVSAMRETSVFFSVAIAAFWLKEKVQGVHWFAGGIAVFGTFLIRLG